MTGKKREKIIPIAIGIGFVLLLSALLYFSPGPLQKWLQRLQNISYDLMVRFEYKPVRKDTPIVVVDIDDKSIS